MANELLSLTLQIGAQTAELQKGISDANNKLSSFASGAKKIGGILAGAFSAAAIIGAGKAVFEFSQEIGKATDKVASLTKLVGSDLVDATAKASSIASTFEMDFNKILSAANTVSRELGIGVPEALDKIRDGIALTGTKSEEFLDILNEYPSQFAAMGISADQFFALTAKGLNEGAFGDKFNDAIKEAGIRLREMPASTATALAAIDINALKIQNAIKTGTMTTFEAIQLVTKRMSDFGKSSQEVGMILADVFGGAGEDLGVKLVESIGTASDSFADMTANANESVKANIRLTQANEELNKIWVQMFGNANSGFTNLKATMLEISGKSLKFIRDGIIDISNYFIELYNDSLAFRLVVENIVWQFKTLWGAIKLVWELLVNTFSSTGKIISALFKGEFDKIPGLYAEAMQGVVTAGIEFGKETANNFIESVETAVKAKPIKLISEETIDQANSDLAKINNNNSGSGVAADRTTNTAIPNAMNSKLSATLGTNPLASIDVTPIVTAIEYTRMWKQEVEALYPSR